MSDIPEPLRREIIARIFDRADQLDWDGLSQVERSGAYDRWVDDPDIGGVLFRHLAPERPRVWIKDVPMKHYDRARRGIGPYASLVRRRLPGPDHLTRQTLGSEWVVREQTIRVKPNRCEVSDGRSSRLMIWGKSANFRALIWAGINAEVDHEPTPLLVVVSRQGQRLSDGEITRHILLARQVKIEVRHTILRDIPTSDSPDIPAVEMD